MATTPDGKGYWMVGSDGGIFTSATRASTVRPVGWISRSPSSAWLPTPDGKGYWLVGSDGGIFSYGDAGFYGSAGGLDLTAPTVAIS